MASLFRKTSRGNPDDVGEPVRLPQRWALIFTVASGIGVAVTIVTGNLAAGIGAATAVVALLHKVMD